MSSITEDLHENRNDYCIWILNVRFYIPNISFTVFADVVQKNYICNSKITEWKSQNALIQYSYFLNPNVKGK